MPTPRYFAIVPAAGVGSRMGAECPKQYLPLHGKSVLEHSLKKLLTLPCLERLLVPLAATDEYWRDLPIFADERVTPVNGGRERCDSVLNGLIALTDVADDQDWVLVHDVARPCVRQSDIARLIDSLQHDAVGGILAVPVSDTIKRVTTATLIDATVDRSQLWQAQTPQLFRYGLLRDALGSALQSGAVITDEASALEWAGRQPRVVEGSRDNLKITRPEDLALAEYFLQI